MKIAMIALIVYAIIGIIWFIAEVYFSYKDMYRINRLYSFTGVKASVAWNRIILGSIFWPIDIIVGVIRKIAWYRSK